MAMTFREFMDSQAALLTAFAENWIEKNKEDPEEYPMLMDDLLDWVEQFEAFVEVHAWKKIDE